MLYTNAKDLYKSSFPKSRFKGSSLPQYNYGGSPKRTFLEKGNAFLSSNTGAGISAGAGIAGELISQYAGDGAFAAGASGALKGASAGAQFGLIGAGVGALGGAAYGVLMQQQQAKKEEEAREQKKQEDLAMNYQTSKAILSTYPTEGVADAGFLAAYGGTIKMDKGGIVRPKGDPYEYKKDGDKFLTRKRGSNNWITAKGKAEDAIKSKVFKLDPVMMDYPESTGNLPVMYDNQGNAPAASPVYRGTPPKTEAVKGNEYVIPENIPAPLPPQGPVQAPLGTTTPIYRGTPPVVEPTLTQPLGTTTAINRSPAMPEPSPIKEVPLFTETPDGYKSISGDKYTPKEMKEINKLMTTPVDKKVSTKNVQAKAEPKTVEEVGAALEKNDESKPIVMDDPARIDLSFARQYYDKVGLNKDYIFVVDKPTGAMYQVDLNSGKYTYLDKVGLGKNVGDRDVSGGRKTGGGSNQTQAGWVKINREAEFNQRNKNYGDEFNGFAAFVNGSWKEVPTGIHGTMNEDCGRVSGGCTRMSEELEDTTRDMLTKNTLLYYTSDASSGIPMQAMGGPTDPPQVFDMSMLANNPIKNAPASRQDVLTGYSDAELNVNRAKGNAIAFQNRANILGENLTKAGQYIANNPLDAAQVGLGVVAIGADGIPIVGNAISAGADFVNAGISGGRAAYYANQGDMDNAAFYSGLATLDLAASAPGVGNYAGATKIGRLLNKGIHAAGEVGHTIHHAAHTGSQLATTYKGGKLGEGAVDAMSAETPAVAPLVTESRVYEPTAPITMNTNMNPVDTSWVTGQQYSYMPSQMAAGGKIPTASADYLAEGGEVIQHAVNDRPNTDQNGDIRQLNSNTSLFQGDSHNAPSQGIGVANDQEARIYSKRLYAPKNLVAKLKSL